MRLKYLLEALEALKMAELKLQMYYTLPGVQYSNECGQASAAMNHANNALIQELDKEKRAV